MKKLPVVFYKSDSGNMPVKEWLYNLSKEDRKLIGEDIKTVQYGFPIGMPLVKPLGDKLWEVRSRLTGKAISRVFFTLYKDSIVLLHGFMKKSQKTPQNDIDLAKKRKDKFYEDCKA
jgi:phage-related protein